MSQFLKVASNSFLESLILAQDERWRRGLGMQVKGFAFGRTPANGLVTRGNMPLRRE